METGRRSFDSTRRRARYAAFRYGYITWRALWHEGALGFAAVAFAIGLFAAIILPKLWPQLPVEAFVAPLVVAVAVAAWVVVARLRRVARNYLKLRREMQQQRAFDLLGGGITRTRDRRLKFLLVTLPFGAIMVAGVLVMIIFFPRQRQPVVLFMASVVTAVAVTARYVLTRRYERQRPQYVGLCPRCGYDLHGGPERCPECGLLPPDGDRYWPRRRR